MQPLIIFWNKPPSNPRFLSRRGPRSLELGLSQHYMDSKMTFFHFSNFCRKQFPSLSKRLKHIFIQLWGVVIYKNYVVRLLHSFNKYRKILFSSLDLFFCRNLENVGMSFFGQCNVEIVPVPGFQGLSCSKTVGWRVVCSKKLSMATFFIFLVSYLVDSFLSYLPVKRI